MIRDDRCQKALTYLASTDEPAAELKTQVSRKEFLLDLARKKVFLASEGNIEVRKALAETSKMVQQAQEEYLQAVLEFERIKAKRLTEELIVEVYRTVSANRRMGNLT